MAPDPERDVHCPQSSDMHSASEEFGLLISELQPIDSRLTVANRTAGIDPAPGAYSSTIATMTELCLGGRFNPDRTQLSGDQQRASPPLGQS